MIDPPGGQARPPHRWTAAVLSTGTLAAGACLALGLLLSIVGQGLPSPGEPGEPGELGRLVEEVLALRPWAWSMLGVLVLLATPAAGLVATAVELRPNQPRAALLAVVVLAVLGVAVVIALA